MELTVTQENLNKALALASRIASNRTQLPILGNILLRTEKNRLLVAATNLEIAITRYIGAKVLKQGAITVPAKLVSEFLSNLPKESVDLKVKDNKLYIKCGVYKSIINGVVADDFPELPTINEKSSTRYTLNSEDFKQSISQVIIAASSDPARPTLTGVYWHTNKKHLYLATTDGYRLSEKRLMESDKNIAAIIPTQTLQEVLRIITDDLDEVDVLFDETQVRFRTDETEVISRLIDGEFPNYRQLIPKSSETNIKLNRDDFVRVTKIAGLFSRDLGGSVTLTANKNKGSLSVHSIASELGENTSEAKAEVTKDGQVTLNSRYLSEALSVIEGEAVEFGFSGKIAPTILKSADNNTDYYHVIMPLKS